MWGCLRRYIPLSQLINENYSELNGIECLPVFVSEVTNLVIANKILMTCAAKEDAEYTFGEVLEEVICFLTDNHGDNHRLNRCFVG